MQQDTFASARTARSLRKGLIAAATALPLVLSATGGAQAANDVIIGAHEAGSTYYVIGAAVADVVSKNTKLTGKLITAGGAAVWVPRMDSKESDLGVVNDEFAVYGYENLFVCDASVFPSSIGVNPQLTVMALADYAVPFIAANGLSR